MGSSLDEASQIYKIIQQHFKQLANGYDFFDDKEETIEYAMEK